MKTHICLTVVAALVAGFVLIVSLLDSAACGWKWSGSGYETRWDMFGGCKVQIDGRLIPDDRVRAFD